MDFLCGSCHLHHMRQFYEYISYLIQAPSNNLEPKLFQLSSHIKIFFTSYIELYRVIINIKRFLINLQTSEKTLTFIIQELSEKFYINEKNVRHENF